MKDAARFFKVLADEARHLARLKHAGLVTDRKDGLWSHYALRPADDGLANTHLALLRRSLADTPDAAALLKTLHGWLNGKDRSVACARGVACVANATKKKTTTRQRKAAR